MSVSSKAKVMEFKKGADSVNCVWQGKDAPGINALQVSTETPIKSIAAEVGYEDICFFSRLFKQHACISPDAYRKAARGQ